MIKRIVYFTVIAFALFLVGYFTNNYILEYQKKVLSFSLLSVYIYQVIATIIVYILIEVISYKLPNQAGYAYLASIFFKIGFFVMLFQTTIFAKEHLIQAERFSLVISIFIFLIAEVIAISKRLNRS